MDSSIENCEVMRDLNKRRTDRRLDIVRDLRGFRRRRK